MHEYSGAAVCANKLLQRLPATSAATQLGTTNRRLVFALQCASRAQCCHKKLLVEPQTKQTKNSSKVIFQGHNKIRDTIKIDLNFLLSHKTSNLLRQASICRPQHAIEDF